MSKKEDQKETKKMNKKAFWSIGILFVVMLIAGALILWVKYANKDLSEQNAIQIGEEIATMDEVNVCILQTMMPIGLNEETLSVVLDDGTPADLYYKNSVYEIIKYYKLECQIAKRDKIELSEEEEKAVTGDVATFLKSIDGSVINKFSVTQESVEKVIRQQHLAHKVEEKAFSEIEVEEQHFCSMYIMLFPKIKTDENGEFVMQEDGSTPVMLSDSEIASQKENAQKAREELLATDDLDAVAKKYKVENFSGLQSNMQESFDEEFVDSAKKLKNGQCSDIIDISSCYAIVKMISESDPDKEEEILGNHKKQLENDKLIEKRAEWKKEILGDKSSEKTFRSWNEMSLYDYVD